VFLVSDFLTSDYERPLSVAGRRHDVVAIQMADIREAEIPPIGYMELEDAETGEHLFVNTSDVAFQRMLEAQVIGWRDTRERVFRSTKTDVIEIRTDQPYFDPLMMFFRKRARRFR
jgi:hypothetical protein